MLRAAAAGCAWLAVLPAWAASPRDPCKNFEGLCEKGVVNVASLLEQGFEFKAANIDDGQFILQKGAAAFYCSRIRPGNGVRELPPQVEIGSATCRQIRRGTADDAEKNPAGPQ